MPTFSGRPPGRARRTTSESPGRSYASPFPAAVTDRTSIRRSISSTTDWSPGRSAATVLATRPSKDVWSQSKFFTSMRWWSRSKSCDGVYSPFTTRSRFDWDSAGVTSPANTLAMRIVAIRRTSFPGQVLGFTTEARSYAKRVSCASGAKVSRWCRVGPWSRMPTWCSSVP